MIYIQAAKSLDIYIYINSILQIHIKTTSHITFKSSVYIHPAAVTATRENIGLYIHTGIEHRRVLIQPAFHGPGDSMCIIHIYIYI